MPETPTERPRIDTMPWLTPEEIEEAKAIIATLPPNLFTSDVLRILAAGARENAAIARERLPVPTVGEAHVPDLLIQQATILTAAAAQLETLWEGVM